MNCVSVDTLWMIAKPVDMRKGIEGVTAHIAQHTNHAIIAGEGYLLTNTTGSRLCLLIYDANGVSILKRKLHRGSFSWQSCASVTSILEDELHALAMGLKWQRIHALFDIKILS